MSLNTIAAELLAEKQAAKPEAEPRFCACNCGTELKRNPNEAHYRFKARKYHTHACSIAARTPHVKRAKTKRTCETCGAEFGQRRYKSGKLEGMRDFNNRRFCPEHTSYGNTGVRPPPTTTFSKDTRLPDPTTRETFSHSPKDESNTKRIASLLEAERASGVTLRPVPIERFERAARRVKRLHPDFAAMLRDNVS